MDKIERMNIRAAAAWRKAVKSANTKPMIDPLTGEILRNPEVHHIAQAAYGEASIPLAPESHQEMTRRQMEEHPPAGPDPTNPVERMGRMLLGAADLLESIVDELRRIAEFLIALAAEGFRGM